VRVAVEALTAALAALHGADGEEEATDELAQAALLQAADCLSRAATTAEETGTTLAGNAALLSPAAPSTTPALHHAASDEAVRAALSELARANRDARLECAQLRAELQRERVRSSRLQEDALNAQLTMSDSGAKSTAMLWAALQAAYLEIETMREERDALLARFLTQEMRTADARDV
jgi:hypothetical protein